MTNSFPWPKQGNKAFAFAGDAAYFHMPSTMGMFPPHAQAFKTAAEIILAKCDEDGDRPSNDILILPVVYLYRHSIELHLKAIVRVGIGMCFFKKHDIKEELNGHNLARLWTQAKKLLLHRWPTSDSTALKAVDSVINELHQSDPNGQFFRYDSAKDGRTHRYDQMPERISPAQLAKTMDGILNFLEVTWSELQDNLSDMLAAERENVDY